MTDTNGRVTQKQLYTELTQIRREMNENHEELRKEVAALRTKMAYYSGGLGAAAGTAVFLIERLLM